MKIKALDCFAHASGSFVVGREYEVVDALGKHFVDARLVEEVKPPAQPEAKKPKE